MSASTNQENLRAVLRKRLRGAIVIAGIGNVLRGDDGAGPRLVKMLRERLNGDAGPTPSVHLIDCCETPENHVGSIAKLRPDTVVVVDCASLGLRPGEAQIVEGDGLSETNLSTHGISPALFMNRLREETGADVFMVAVQPGTTTLRGCLSAPVSQALKRLAELIESAIRPK